MATAEVGSKADIGYVSVVISYRMWCYWREAEGYISADDNPGFSGVYRVQYDVVIHGAWGKELDT